MRSITAGGVDISHDPSSQEKESGTFVDQAHASNPPSRPAATQDIVMTAEPASEEGLTILPPENPSANDPSNTSTVEVQESVTGMSANAKESQVEDSTFTTGTAIIPGSDTTPLAEFLMNGSHSITGAKQTSESRTTSTPESQHRRSKLDLSGAKRMLFGSLGLRTPKTKDDELKTREKLMKDVRPLKRPQDNERIEAAEEDVAAAAEDESWKDKIDLRAVECCYEGIELSTPPFPFVQRWDPQQQRGYNVGNARKRKGKKRKRNNHDYYEDSSFSIPNKAVRLDEDDLQRQDFEQKPSTKNNAESNEREQTDDERLDDSLRANEQLLHETEDASADTLVEVEEAVDLKNDLPILPEDMSICSSLTLDKASKGNIVAFKQLEMSAETNWQPKISEYRTAIVDKILDDGTLSMTLAKRDQPSANIHYDEQTGERLYSKFEMPGYQDENGDKKDGKLEISFDELISPVMIEIATEKGSQSVMLKVQDHVAAHIDSNNQAISEEAHDIDAGAQDIGLDGQTETVSIEAAAESSEEARQKISELIRDAGWRSSINPVLTDGQDEGRPGQNDDLDEPALVGSSSPRFHGFGSSPPTNEFQVVSSPPAVAFQTPRRAHASGPEIAESVSPQRADDSPALSYTSKHSFAIDYPNLPQSRADSEVFQQEAQDRFGLLEADHQITSQALTSSSSIRRCPSPSIASPLLNLHEESSLRLVSIVDGADSDDSLPELFSQAFEKRVSQGRDIKAELSEEDPISPPSHRKSRRNKRLNSSQEESNRDWKPSFSESEQEDEGGSTPRPSQQVSASQIVDLTISSDTVDPLDDSYADDDSYILPKGPGWVQKSRLSESRESPAKRITTRGSRRTR